METSTSSLVMLRRKEVEARTGMKRSTIYDYVQKGEFPSPVRLGSRSVAWIESEVNEWIDEQIEKSRGIEG